jgi:hypothetical protein
MEEDLPALLADGKARLVVLVGGAPRLETGTLFTNAGEFLQNMFDHVGVCDFVKVKSTAEFSIGGARGL